MSIVGKSVFMDNRGESWRTGQIAEAVGSSEYFLLKLDDMSGNNHTFYKTVSLEQLSETFDGSMPSYLLFDSREEMEAWMHWIMGPDDSEPKVVSMTGKGRAK